MAQLQWNAVGNRFYETGVDRGVLYPQNADGVAWSGLIAVTENSSGGEATGYYFDGVRFITKLSNEEFAATIEAYTYPDEFMDCDGTTALLSGLLVTAQRRKPFGFSYRTKLGNDTQGLDRGYRLHLVYNASATPSDRGYKTISDSPDLMSFSWNVETVPENIPGGKPSAHLMIDSTSTDPFIMTAVEALLYGSDDNQPELPSPADLIALFTPPTAFIVTDNGDGSFTISGPDDAVFMTDDTHFELNSVNVVLGDDDTYTATSST